MRAVWIAGLLPGCTGSGSIEGPTPAADVVEQVLTVNEIGCGERGADWIELWNPSSTAIPLVGYALADGRNEPAPLPAGFDVPAGGYLVLAADGRLDLGPLHLPFGLDRDGETVLLTRGGAVLEALAFGELAAGFSLARTGDGGADWAVRADPTPGAANPGASAGGKPGERRCGLTADAPRDLIEGSSLFVALGCAEADRSDFAYGVVSADGRGSIDTAGYTLPLGLADAGTRTMIATAKAVGSVGIPETVRVEVDVIDAWDAAGNTAVDPTTYRREYGLRVLHLFPQGELTQNDVDADAVLDGVSLKATMKIRGAAAASYPKHHFTVEFEPEQADFGAEGLGRKDHVVLMSNFDDNAYVRSKLVFDAWAAMRETAPSPRASPRTGFLVLFLGGEYHGLYTIADHIDDEFLEETGFAPTSNLYKSVTHDANFDRIGADGQPKDTLHDGWEQKEGTTWDFADLDALTAWVADHDAGTFAAEVEGWLDVAEFADWFLLVHHLAAADSAGKNAYLFHDPGSGLFRYVPWDFNHALGQDWRTLRVDADWFSDFTGRNRVFRHIQTDPGLSALLWARYVELRRDGAPLSSGWQLDRLSVLYALIEPSARRDWARWGGAYASYGGWAESRAGDLLDFDGERAYLEAWIADRDAAMRAYHPMPEGL